MLFILGLKPRVKTLDTGQFHCPNENGTRRYRSRRARRWVTFFFVPVIPLGTQGEWVECDSCGSQYHTSILGQMA